MIDIKHIPAPMRELNQWVCWKYQKRPGAAKPTKNLFACDDSQASSTNPATWASLSDCLLASPVLGMDGVGFVFTRESGMVGIDLDNCLREDGSLKDWAVNLVAMFPTYMEISPSGLGVKIFCKGPVIEHGRAVKVADGQIENYSWGRYFTVTGNSFGSPQPLTDCSNSVAELLEILEGVKPTKIEQAPPSADSSGNDMDRREKRCMAYFAKIPDAVSGQGGHNRTLYAACTCVRFGLDDAASRRCMYWFNQNKTGGEQWTDREISHKLESARKLAAHQAGAKLIGPSDRKSSGNEKTAITDAETPIQQASGVIEQQDFMLTDAGNGERFAAQWRHLIRFDSGLGSWRHYDGMRWARDETEIATALARTTCRDMLKLAAKTDDDRKRKDLSGHAVKTEKRERLSAMIALAKSVPGMCIVPAQWDTDPWLFNVRNGTLDLQTGELRPHNPDDLITKLAPVDYEPGAISEAWDVFLGEIFLNNHDLISYTRRLHGYCMSGNCSEHIFPVYHGHGANGKSTLLDVICHIMGDYASLSAPDLLTARKDGWSAHPTEIADLAGKRLVVVSESEKVSRLRIQFVKRITGDARLKGRFMSRDFFEFDRTFTPILVTNNKPTVDEDTEATWRRIRLTPFNFTVQPEKMDKDLPAKLLAEASGILSWLVMGCLEARSGLNPPAVVMQATNEYRADSDPLADWISECCTIATNAWSASATIRNSYEKFCDARGDVPVKGREFTDLLKKHGAKPDPSNNIRGWSGIHVQSSQQEVQQSF